MDLLIESMSFLMSSPLILAVPEDGVYIPVRILLDNCNVLKGVELDSKLCSLKIDDTHIVVVFPAPLWPRNEEIWSS